VQINGGAYRVGTAMQVTHPVEPFHGQGQAGEKPDRQQAVALMVADVFKPVAVLGVVEPLVLDFPAALGHAEDGPAADSVAREVGEPVRLTHRAVGLVLAVANHPHRFPAQRFPRVKVIGVPDFHPVLLLHTAVTVALNTTLRKNEIRLLRWGQIDFFKRTLTVGKSKTETGTGREIPLNPPAYAAMLKWAGRFPDSKAEDYVFPACEAAGIEREHPDKARIDPSKPIKSWRTAWRAALRRAGLQLRFHDLRHTCVTKLAEGQAGEQTIMAIAGHLSRRMLEHYSHLRMAAKRAALDAIATAAKQATFEAAVHQIVHQVPEGQAVGVANSLN